MDRCLITGCGGFVGSYLAEYLLSHGCQVAGVVRRDSPHLRDLAGRVEIFTCDVTDRPSLTRVIREVGSRFVFHLAAEDVIPRSWEDPKTTIETNLIGTISILEDLREVAAGAVVRVAGSASEYGRRRPRELPIREAQVPHPQSPYAVSKTAAIQLAQLYAARYEMRVHCVRPFQFIGPRKLPDVVSEFAKQIAPVEKWTAKGLRVGNLETVRDLLDVRDGVKAMWLAAQTGKSGEIYNICSGTGCTVGSILHQLMALAGVSVPVRADPARWRSLDIPVIIGDNTKIRALGWQAEIPLAETLRQVLQYWRQAPD
jgi:GDP-4-dehydro-6-deoxy-D-mannose reductase